MGTPMCEPLDVCASMPMQVQAGVCVVRTRARCVCFVSLGEGKGPEGNVEE